MERLHYSLSEFRFEMQLWLSLLNQKTKAYCCEVLNNEGLVMGIIGVSNETTGGMIDCTSRGQ